MSIYTYNYIMIQYSTMGATCRAGTAYHSGASEFTPIFGGHLWTYLYKHHKHYETFEDTSEIIRSRQLKKDRRYNDQKKTDKRTNNQQQSITNVEKYRLTAG
jgi:hypothetical protein